MVLGYLEQLLAIFIVLSVLIYLVPAGIFYWIFFIRPSGSNDLTQIQDRQPSAADVRRELKDSFYALALFSIYTLFLYQAYLHGHTAIYMNVHRYPLWWLPVSFFCAMFLHDTYFYFTHRLMHTKTLFRLCHTRHHKSITPTPWAILSFQPLETVFQFGFFALLVTFVPLHPVTLVIYLFYDELVNAAGHCGHEFVPSNLQHHWFLKYSNAVTHHDLHHSKVRCNYGHYFNFWDRLMGTFSDREVVDEPAQTHLLEPSLK